MKSPCRFLAVPVLFCFFSSELSAAPVAADWLTTSTGTLNGVSFTSTGFGGPFLAIDSRNYSGPNFSAAPVGPAEALQYSANNDWSVTFSSAITNLLLFVDSWRGDFNGGTVDPTSTYTFSRPFSIASGLAGATISGNTLSLADNVGFYNGVLLFSGSVNALSVDATALNGSGQDLTFGVEQVPEPVSALLFSGGLVAILLASRGRRSGSMSQ